MSQFWRETPAGDWENHDLKDGLLANHEDTVLAGVRLIELGHNMAGKVGILVKPDVPLHVNGRAVAGGFKLANHQDEITVGLNRFYISAERPPKIVTFHPKEGERSPTCPICRGRIMEGDQAVCCPRCGRWFHEKPAIGSNKEKPCWTYKAQCSFCGHPTDLDGKALWQPEQEESNV